MPVRELAKRYIYLAGTSWLVHCLHHSWSVRRLLGPPTNSMEWLWASSLVRPRVQELLSSMDFSPFGAMGAAGTVLNDPALNPGRIVEVGSVAWAEIVGPSLFWARSQRCSNGDQGYCEKQKVDPGQLVLHADRGPSMTSQPVAQLLATLGVTKTHSRPRVSNDNPYSEAQFKTLKYRPEFPDRFGSIEDAIGFSRDFFAWYNTEHHHTALGLLTPAMVHYGRANEVINARNEVLAAAYRANPERFVRRMPKAPELPKEVWINRPKSETVEQLH